MTTSGETKINTKLFSDTAETIGDTVKKMSGHCNEWSTAANSLRGTWQGDTSDNIKNTVGQLQKSASEMLQILSGYRAALLEIAGIYNATEKDIKETGAALKSDGVFK
ncbi:MAG: WXG100 family type VII secretion target [Oscillospiraceae bacterium]|jgi:WXG100 family type VII secretion target|nr:WXG100 family type VII secretion target [Oscillospiraceae bacterium]